MKDITDMIELMADKRFTINVALSPLQAYSSSAIGVSSLLMYICTHTITCYVHMETNTIHGILHTHTTTTYGY